MEDISTLHVVWAVALGSVSAASLPLGSLIGLNVRFQERYIALFAAFGAGALIAALSVELVAPTAFLLIEAEPGLARGHARIDFYALIIGGVLGGLLFVALDAVVNSKGGYIRKTSSTLAHLARHRRKKIDEVMKGVLDTRPFNALPGDMAQVVAGMLSPTDFDKGKQILGPNEEPSAAYIVLEGEIEVELVGKPATAIGPGAMVGVLPLFVPTMARAATIIAKTNVRCLAIKREDFDHIRTLSADFDEACRRLAGERMDQLEEYLTTRLHEAVEWTHSAAAALRLGTEVPALTIRKAHDEAHGSPLAVWLGILLDGIPESIVIGAGLFTILAVHPDVDSLRFVHVIPYTLVAGLFLSNFPEALSSSANMQTLGWTQRRIFLMWFALMVMTAAGAGLGYLLAGVLSETWLVFAEGVAAGAMLTMIAAAMIPEAARHGNPNSVGLSTLIGFLGAVLFKLLE